MQTLVQFAQQNQLAEWIGRLFSTATGPEKINYTEQRDAMHWALRLPATSPAASASDQTDAYAALTEQVHIQLERMYALVEKIHAGQYRGATGEVIQDVVNIGVGGSDLGPLMVTQALSDFKVATEKPLNVHFVSTMDGSQLSELLHRLRPETTLFIISSKSFGTIDTLSNAQTVKQWLEKALGTHAGFLRVLAGSHAVDQHFQTAAFEQNIPVLMGLLGVWNNNFLNIQTHAVLPYDGRLKYFASYLQQLEMESNGKSIQRNGKAVSLDTCPIVWGEGGPNAQHAFYLLQLQGTLAVS